MSNFISDPMEIDSGSDFHHHHSRNTNLTHAILAQKAVQKLLMEQLIDKKVDKEEGTRRIQLVPKLDTDKIDPGISLMERLYGGQYQ